MKAQVKFYPSKDKAKAAQIEILGTLGTDKPLGSGDAFVIISFRGVGTWLSVEEALGLGLTEADLKASIEAPQEFEIKLQKPPVRAKE